MSIVNRLLLASMIACTAMTSCDTAPTGPGPSTGNLLQATVGGAQYSFTLTPGAQTYEASATLGRIGGATTTGATTRAIGLSFISDITTGAYPRTLSDDRITISYVVSTNGVITDTYYCAVHPDRCAITLTANSSQIVDGTFSARLTSQNDTSKHLEITAGAFSAKLENQ